MIDVRDVNIYVLKHPDTLEVRYVGKTVRKLSRRLGNHVANAKGNQHNKHLSHWILKLLKEGKRPIIELVETCTYDIWQERERYWIRQFPNLINLTEGGDGCIGFLHSPETRKKISLLRKGKKHTQEWRDYMSRTLKGRKLTQEHKDKISAANRGRKHSEETRKKNAESHKGIKQSEETRRKRSETIRLWWAKRKSNEDIVKS